MGKKFDDEADDMDYIEAKIRKIHRELEEIRLHHVGKSNLKRNAKTLDDDIPFSKRKKDEEFKDVHNLKKEKNLREDDEGYIELNIFKDSRSKSRQASLEALERKLGLR